MQPITEAFLNRSAKYNVWKKQKHFGSTSSKLLYYKESTKHISGINKSFSESRVHQYSSRMWKLFSTFPNTAEYFLQTRDNCPPPLFFLIIYIVYLSSDSVVGPKLITWGDNAHPAAGLWTRCCVTVANYPFRRKTRFNMFIIPIDIYFLVFN